MTDQAKYARALHALRDRFEALGAEWPDEEAKDYLRRLIADGWTTRQTVAEPVSSGPRSSKASEYAARIRADLRRASIEGEQ